MSLRRSHQGLSAANYYESFKSILSRAFLEETSMGTPMVQTGSPSSEKRSVLKAAQRAEAFGQLADKSLGGCYNEKVADILQSHSYNFVLSDPHLPDNPIVYASQGFLSMTGYSREEIIGRNCRFLQGPDTDRRTVLMIREACREERAVQVS